MEPSKLIITTAVTTTTSPQPPPLLLVGNFFFLNNNQHNSESLQDIRLFKIPSSTLQIAKEFNSYQHHIISETPVYLKGDELLFLVHCLDNPSYIEFYPNDRRVPTNSSIDMFVPYLIYNNQLWVIHNIKSKDEFVKRFTKLTEETEAEYNSVLFPNNNNNTNNETP